MTKSIPPIPIKIGDGNATFAVNGQTCGEHSHEMTMETLNCIVKLTERCQGLEAQVRDMAELINRSSLLMRQRGSADMVKFSDRLTNYLRKNNLLENADD